MKLTKEALKKIIKEEMKDIDGIPLPTGFYGDPTPGGELAPAVAAARKQMQMDKERLLKFIRSLSLSMDQVLAIVEEEAKHYRQ